MSIKLPYLIVHKGKHDDCCIVATTEEEYKQGWLCMFHCLRLWDEFYYDVEDWDEDQREWYNMAMAGDYRGAMWLLDYRSGYEYEYVHGEPLNTVERIFELLGMTKCDTCGNYVDKCRAVPGCIVSGVLPSYICKECDPQ